MNYEVIINVIIALALFSAIHFAFGVGFRALFVYLINRRIRAAQERELVKTRKLLEHIANGPMAGAPSPANGYTDKE